LKYSIIAWALVANLQFVFKKPIVGLLLPRVSFYYGRNFAIGFAPEPSFFSKLMISMLMLSNFVVYNKKDRIIINFLVIEGVFLSASLSGMLILVCYYALGLIDYFIRGISTYKKAQKRVVVALMIVFLAYFFSTKIAPLISGPEFGRITDMLERIGASGILAILNDQSFSNRLIHIDNARYVVKEGLIQGVGIPEYPSGGMFGIIYESGLFGLIFVFMMIILTIARAITGQREHRFMTLSYMVLILLLIFTDTVANPIYWFLWFETINCRIVTYPDAVGSGQSSCT